MDCNDFSGYSECDDRYNGGRVAGIRIREFGSERHGFLPVV